MISTFEFGLRGFDVQNEKLIFVCLPTIKEDFENVICDKLPTESIGLAKIPTLESSIE